jgi:recombination protein RecA
MSQALRKLSGAISKSKTIALFINQIREKIGVMFGNPETTPGGRALKFYSSVRLEVRRAETLKQGNDMVGNKTRIKVVKNKVAPPFKQAEVDIMYGEGISKQGSVLDIAADLDIVLKSGAWYSFKEERIGQGRENSKIFLKEHPEMMAEIEGLIRAHHGLDGQVEVPVPDEKEFEDVPLDLK